jgi:hypothetical protein
VGCGSVVATGGFFNPKSEMGKGDGIANDQSVDSEGAEKIR